MAQMLGFSRFSRVLQVLQNFQNFQTSQEYRIPVPSPRNRANHGPSMPCHGPLPMTGEINERQLITVSSRILDALEDGKTNQTSPGRHPMLTNAVAFGTSQTHPRRPETRRDAVAAVQRTPLQTAEVQPRPDWGMWGSRLRKGADSVRSGACPGRRARRCVSGPGCRRCCDGRRAEAAVRSG